LSVFFIFSAADRHTREKRREEKREKREL